LTKEDYGDWDEVLANIPENPLDEHLSQIDWGQDGAQRGTDVCLGGGRIASIAAPGILAEQGSR
jgi:hypothetical protein